MATTTNFGWETPDDTDLVKDGAAAIRTALGGVDTSFVDLKGGTTGQVLSKASNTDLDFSWVATDDTNAIQNAIVDAKGDLISATAADTPARLAVGTNGQILTADSTTATGLKWAAAAGGGSFTKIKTGTFSGVTSTTTTFDGVFTSTYRNYFIAISNIQCTTNNQALNMGFRNAGSTLTSSLYGSRLKDASVNTFTNQTAIPLLILANYGVSSINLTFNRSSAQPITSFYGFERYGQGSITGGTFEDVLGADSADGFILSAPSGNISGTVTVYGLEN